MARVAMPYMVPANASRGPADRRFPVLAAGAGRAAAVAGSAALRAGWITGVAITWNRTESGYDTF